MRSRGALGARKPQGSPAGKSSNLELPVPRNRTVRLAVLGSSVQRSALQPTSRSGTALRRRLVVGLLVLLSLMLMTISFRESPSAAAHAPGHGRDRAAAVPGRRRADRAAVPGRYGYLAASSTRSRRPRSCARRTRALRASREPGRDRAPRGRELRALLDLRFPAAFPQDFDRVAASVTAPPPSAYEQRVVISAGWNDGVRRNDAGVNGDGLVGKVIAVGRNTAKVLLLTDELSAVAAADIAKGRARPG